MQNPKFWAIIGFQPNEENVMRLNIQGVYSHVLEWVAGNNNELDVAIINVAFIDNVKIVEYLEKISKTKVKVAIGCRNLKEASIAKEKGLPVLNLAKLDKEYLQVFLPKLLSEEFNNKIKPKVIEQVKLIREPSSQVEILDLIRNLQITSGNIKLTIDNKSVLVDGIKKSVWINYPREEVFGLERVDWQDIEEISVDESYANIKLDQWLFSAIWHTRMKFDVLDKVSSYKLKRWPQPLGKHSRSAVLRLTAELQKRPMSLNELQRESNLPIEIVKRFIASMVYVNQVEVISKTDSILNTTESRLEKVVDEVKLSLLQKIRAKFGL